MRGRKSFVLKYLLIYSPNLPNPKLYVRQSKFKYMKNEHLTSLKYFYGCYNIDGRKFADGGTRIGNH
jgi:hypothetical protein